MVIAMVLVLIGIAVALIYGVGLKPPKRPTAPKVASRTVIAQVINGQQTINAGLAAGRLMVVEGQDIWIAWSVTDATCSRICITHSADAGLHFDPTVDLTPGFHSTRCLQPSLSLNPPASLALVCVSYGDIPGVGQGSGVKNPQERTSQIQVMYLPHRAIVRPGFTFPITWETQASVSSPMFVSGDLFDAVLFLETTNHTQDRLRCWVDSSRLHLKENEVRTVPVDDDPTGAPKLGFAAAWSGGKLHVVYADGRNSPNQGDLLYYTSVTDPLNGFAPSKLIDPPADKFWQIPPSLTVGSGGELLIGSSTVVSHYFPVSYRDKLSRFGVGGLSQVTAYTREPEVWRSTDNGATWKPTLEIDDEQVEISSGGVQVAKHGDQVLTAWMENRPVTEAADIRWALTDRLGSGFTASSVVNDPPQDGSGEVLYDVAWLPDGSVCALYRDSKPLRATDHTLVLARSEPIRTKESE